MTLFVLNQVAGAEYVAPLLTKWMRAGRRDWTVYAAPVSADLLTRAGIPHQRWVVEADADAEAVANAVVDRVGPRAAVLSTSVNDPMEHVFVAALRARRIPSAQFIDYWVNYRARFLYRMGQGDPQLPDYIVTIDEIARKEMMAEGLPDDRIIVVGQPHLEQQMLRHCARPTGERAIRALVITQPVSRFFGASLGYDEGGFVTGVLETWQASGRTGDDLDIMVHPAEELSRYSDLARSYAGTIRVLRSGAVGLEHYGLAVGMYSTVMVDTLLAGARTVSFQPGAVGDDKCFLSRHGYIPRATSVAELRSLVSATAPVRGTGHGVHDFVRMLEGSTDRLERFVLDVLNREDG